MSDFPLMEKTDDGNTEITKLFVYGPTGLLAVNDDEGWFFMLKDHLGSTRAVINETNSVVTSYDYMPFGNIMRSSVNTEVSYQFTGQEYDTETELHNFRARLYDSDLGMFYAVDPAGQGYNPFAYAGNNPIIRVDRDGQFWQFVVAGAIMGGFMGATQAEANDELWYQGLWKGALVGAIGGALAPIGNPGAWGGFQNILTGAGQGFLTGGLSSALHGFDFIDGTTMKYYTYADLHRLGDEADKVFVNENFDESETNVNELKILKM